MAVLGAQEQRSSVHSFNGSTLCVHTQLNLNPGIRSDSTGRPALTEPYRRPRIDELNRDQDQAQQQHQLRDQDLVFSSHPPYIFQFYFCQSLLVMCRHFKIAQIDVSRLRSTHRSTTEREPSSTYFTTNMNTIRATASVRAALLIL